MFSDTFAKVADTTAMYYLKPKTPDGKDTAVRLKSCWLIYAFLNLGKAWYTWANKSPFSRADPSRFTSYGSQDNTIYGAFFAHVYKALKFTIFRKDYSFLSSLFLSFLSLILKSKNDSLGSKKKGYFTFHDAETIDYNLYASNGSFVLVTIYVLVQH